MSVVEIATIFAAVSGVAFAAWRVAAYYSKLNADAHQALGDRIDANGRAIARVESNVARVENKVARVEGKVDTLIEMLRPRA